MKYIENYADILQNKYKSKYYLLQADFFTKIRNLFHIHNDQEFVKIVFKLGELWYNLLNHLKDTDQIDEYGFPTFETFLKFVRQHNIKFESKIIKIFYNSILQESKNK